MPKLRTLSDGSKYVTCDEKITRRLDALTKFEANHVISGCEVNPAYPAVTVATINYVSIEAGVVVMNNQRKNVSAVASMGVGTWSYDKYLTIYLPSTGAISAVPTIAMVGSVMVGSTSTGYCPDHNMQGTATVTVVPRECILLAHLYRDASTATAVTIASQINNNVKPRLYFDTIAWQKDNNTDTDTSVV